MIILRTKKISTTTKITYSRIIFSFVNPIVVKFDNIRMIQVYQILKYTIDFLKTNKQIKILILEA